MWRTTVRMQSEWRTYLSVIVAYSTQMLEAVDDVDRLVFDFDLLRVGVVCVDVDLVGRGGAGNVSDATGRVDVEDEDRVVEVDGGKGAWGLLM